MAKAKTIEMESSLGVVEFDLNHAQRILQYQAAHPRIRDKWEIVGEKYTFDTVKNELVGTANRSTGKKSEAREGT